MSVKDDPLFREALARLNRQAYYAANREKILARERARRRANRVLILVARGLMKAPPARPDRR